jgi:hypothetical protein
MSVNPIKDSGIGSVVIDNEDFEGSGAFIVLTRDKNDIILQMKTIIARAWLEVLEFVEDTLEECGLIERDFALIVSQPKEKP